MTHNPQGIENMTPKPNPNLKVGGGFWDALVLAYGRADTANRLALEHGFPTLRALAHAHSWQRFGRDEPDVCRNCGAEGSDGKPIAVWTPVLCDTINPRGF